MQRLLRFVLLELALMCAARAQTAPVIVSQPVSISAVAGEYPTFSVGATGDPAPTYQWFRDGIPIAGATGSTLTVIKAFVAGTYTVVVANPYGAITSAQANLMLRYDGPTPVFSQFPQSLSVNLGATATLSVGTSGTPVSWLKNGVPIAGANSPVFTIASVQLSDAGSYSAVTSQQSATAESPRAQLWVNLAPGASYFNSWTVTAPLPSTLAVSALAFDGGSFLVAGGDGSLFRSPDGAAWTPLPALPERLNSLVFVGPPYGLLAVGDNGVIASFAAPDYAPRFQQSGTSAPLAGIAAGGGRLVAVGLGGTILTANFQFAGWAPGFTGTRNNLDAVAYGNGVFVAVGSGPTVLTSPDGAVWTTQTIGATSELFGVAFGPAGFVAVGGSSIFTSPDGVTWTAQTAPPNVSLGRIIFANPLLVAVGAAGEVVVSTDGGFTWTARNAGTAQALEGVAMGSNAIVAVGTQGTVAESAAASSRLVNLSIRALVGGEGNSLTAGSNAMVAGFVIAGNTSDQLLIRGIGPGLSAFAVGGFLANPTLTLYDGEGNALAANNAWGGSAALAAAFSQVGAFSVPPGSNDAALLVALAPGAYTAQVSGANGAGGTALLELYEAQ